MAEGITSKIDAAYCDGGIIGTNPSTLGGTWAYVLVNEDGEKVAGLSGYCLPIDGSVITNNYTELFAALRAMEALPDDWQGTIYTDSKITLGRITRGSKFTNIPIDIEQRVRKHRERLRHKCVLVSGHPTFADLARGRTARGRLVSEWNVACDEQCKRLAKEFFAKLTTV